MQSIIEDMESSFERIETSPTATSEDGHESVAKLGADRICKAEGGGRGGEHLLKQEPGGHTDGGGSTCGTEGEGGLGGSTSSRRSQGPRHRTRCRSMPGSRPRRRTILSATTSGASSSSLGACLFKRYCSAHLTLELACSGTSSSL